MSQKTDNHPCLHIVSAIGISAKLLLTVAAKLLLTAAAELTAGASACKLAGWCLDLGCLA